MKKENLILKEDKNTNKEVMSLKFRISVRSLFANVSETLSPF